MAFTCSCLFNVLVCGMNVRVNKLCLERFPRLVPAVHNLRTMHAMQHTSQCAMLPQYSWRVTRVNQRHRAHVAICVAAVRLQPLFDHQPPLSFDQVQSDIPSILFCINRQVQPQAEVLIGSASGCTLQLDTPNGK